MRLIQGRERLQRWSSLSDVSKSRTESDVERTLDFGLSQRETEIHGGDLASSVSYMGEVETNVFWLAARVEIVEVILRVKSAERSQRLSAGRVVD